MAEYKGFNIAGDGTFGYCEIKPIGKGSVHLSLRGVYTSPLTAQRAIDKFLSDKVGKGDETNKCD